VSGVRPANLGAKHQQLPDRASDGSGHGVDKAITLSTPPDLGINFMLDLAVAMKQVAVGGFELRLQEDFRMLLQWSE
jgi:hypothetical protein